MTIFHIDDEPLKKNFLRIVWEISKKLKEYHDARTGALVHGNINRRWHFRVINDL